MRVVVGSDIYITSPTFVGADGETAADCASTPTLSVARGDGSAITTVPIVDDPTTGDGQYRAKLLAATHTDKLDALTLTWTGTADSLSQTYTQEVPVAGGTYASLASLRKVLDDPAVFPASVIERVRSEFEDIAEEYTGCAYVPRAGVAKLVGDGTRTAVLPEMFIRSVDSVVLDGTTLDPSVYEWNDVGLVTLTNSSCFTAGKSLVVTYTFGQDRPPAGLVNACKEFIRAQLLRARTNLPRNMLSVSTEAGVERVATANWDTGNPTGWLNVDAALNQLPDHRTPRVA